MNKPLLSTLIVLLFFNTSILMAQWERTNFDQSAWDMCLTGNGNLIAANDIYPEMGGLYISENEGETWVKTLADDYAYSSHLVKDESVYFGGNGANVAISPDNGETWINVNFSDLFLDVTDQDPMYAIEHHNGRIYASVFGLGVAYSTDEGTTWSLADIDSLLDENNPEDGGQWTYDLRSYNGKLYNIGSFGIWEYNEVDDLWTKVDDRWYGGHSTIVDDVLYVSYNAIGIPDGIRYTTDFQNWEVMPLPNGVNTSVRFLEYYEGAFFMGHVNDAIFYTMDHGENWIEYRENYPKYTSGGGFVYYGVPMNLVFSGESMFCGIFSPFAGVGGVYRAPIPPEILGLDEMSVPLKIVVYPNPAKDIVSLQIPQGQGFQGILKITDAMGRIVYNNTLANETDNLVTISIKTWPSGLYIYTLVSGDSKTSGKFLVN